MMSNPRRLFGVLAAAVLLVALANGLALARESDEAPALYTLGSDPTKPALRVTVSPQAGGFLPIPSFALYPDGRLVREFARGFSLIRSETVDLSTEQVAAILDPAVAANLPETTAASLDAQRGSRFSLEDGSIYVLELRFASYRRLGKDTVFDLESRLEFETPHLQAKEYPNLAPVGAFLELLARLDAHFAVSMDDIAYGLVAP